MGEIARLKIVTQPLEAIESNVNKCFERVTSHNYWNEAGQNFATFWTKNWKKRYFIILLHLKGETCNRTRKPLAFSNQTLKLFHWILLSSSQKNWLDLFAFVTQTKVHWQSIFFGRKTWSDCLTVFKSILSFSHP